jgi:leucyl-tRNA synthetase
MFKRYVDVIVYHDRRGEIQPLFMKWENKTYKIEKTEYIGMRNSHVGATGVLYLCQINGKLRDKLEVPADTSKEELETLALASQKVQANLEGKAPKKVIVVPNKLVSIVA